VSAVRSPERTVRGRGSPRSRAAAWLLRLGTAALLAVDAYVHANDAGNYDFNGTTITQGTIFRIEAAVASLAALLVLVWRRRAGWLPALVTAGSALAAVLVYRYIDVGTLGPLPDMYEPTWDVPGKLLSAYAEGGATSLALLGLLITHNRTRRHQR
jgi:hypothetical protein